MKIETKYNLGDTVYFIPINQMPVNIIISPIIGIRLFQWSGSDEISIQYETRFENCIPENEIALNREDALKIFDSKLKTKLPDY